MSLFSKIFGGAASSPTHTGVGVRPRQFIDNTSKSDYAEWFANAPGWRDIDHRLSSVVIERLYGNPMFEVFVRASYDCNLISRYKPLGALFDKGVGDVAACPQVAAILCAAGLAESVLWAELSRDTRQRDAAGRHYYNALNALEAAIHVEPDCLEPYRLLAEIKKMVGKKSEAIEFCEKGLGRIKLMAAIPLPDRMRQATDEAQSALSSLLRELRA